MEPINPPRSAKLAAPKSETLILACLVVLPYASYLALVTLALWLAWSLYRSGQDTLKLLYRQGWLWLTLGIVVTTLLSMAPGESALESVNFIPFFLFYGALATAIARFSQPVQTLRTWAIGLVLAVIPINLRAIVEFYFKAPSVVERWMGHPWLDWLYLPQDYGHRASSVFGHPNALANYLILVFGLALGLCADSLTRPQRPREKLWIYLATALILVGIFCSGSRNGLLVAGLQLLCFGWLLRRYRFVVLTGLGTGLALATGVLAWGVGGRSVIEAFSTITLRFDVWRVAAGMVANHPWLGTGLGTFKFEYKPYTIPIYESLPHPHNLWLMLATGMGIPMAIAFTVVVGLIVARGVKTLWLQPFPRSERIILAAYGIGFAGSVAFALFDLAFYDSRVNVLGWLMLAVIQVIPELGAASAQGQAKSV